MNLTHGHITEAVIGAAFEVYRHLGYGFLENVYKHAMRVELAERGFDAEVEPPTDVFFKDEVVGRYNADLLVESKVVVELKVGPQYNPSDEAQLLNELNAIRHEVGLLINFGREKVEFKRLVLGRR